MNYNQTLINEYTDDNLLVEKETNFFSKLAQHLIKVKVDENKFLPKEKDSVTAIYKYYDFIDRIVVRSDIEMFEKIQKFGKEDPQQKTRVFDLGRLIKREENKDNKNIDLSKIMDK